ncbi:MAG: CpsD/CapB family tyrosine-protein kinase [Planctomycetota bacterium]
MSDKPDNQSSDPKNSEEQEFDQAPEPEQIWPPPDAKASESPETESAASEGLDTFGSDSSDEELDIDAEALDASPRGGGLSAGEADEPATDMLAGKVGWAPPVSSGGTTSAVCEVRGNAHGELGQLWGSVFFSSVHPAPRAIIVTAAKRRDGASQIAIALALIGAESSRESHIALVDFNLRNPAIAELMSIPGEPGLTDVLDGRATLEEAMHAVTMPNGSVLHVLPSGPRADQPLGLIKSRQTQSLIARLRERYDHTIIDVTTANAHPDPQVIGSQVDGALLVVQSGDTSRETVAEAKKRLDLAGVRCLGLVLNQRSDPVPDFLYRRT